MIPACPAFCCLAGFPFPDQVRMNTMTAPTHKSIMS